MTNYKVEIYTDGSNTKDVKCGYGAVILNHKEEKSATFYGRETNPAYTALWNVGVEIRAVEKAIEYCAEHNLNDICVYHDYRGIGEWADKRWKTNNDVTKKYQTYVNTYRAMGMHIDFQWIKGHTGHKYNEMADDLAKKGRESPEDTFVITEYGCLI